MLILVILSACIIGTGCISLSDDKNPKTNASTDTPQSVAQYKVTLIQPEGWSAFFKMDADIYNQGEAVEFYIRNDGSRTLDCSSDPSSFSVRYQQANGTWAEQYRPVPGNTSQHSYLMPGESTGIYRFATTGWEPTRYRIVSDCQISHDILIRSQPTVVPTVCPATDNATPWIRIDPIVNQEFDETLTLSGTTNLAAGKELPYSLFSIPPGGETADMNEEFSSSTGVQEGTCGINTWSVNIRISTAKNYFLKVSDDTKKVTAIKRFTIYTSG
jgi:hypothetical protein